MDSAIAEVSEDQASPQDYDNESSFEVISDSDDPVSSETDHSPPAKPVDETLAPALMPDLGNEASSSIIVLSGSGSASKNGLSATAELVAETPGCLPAPAPTPDTETENSASSSLVLLSESGSTDKTVQSAPAKPVDEKPAPTPDPETAGSSSLVFLAGSGSACKNFQSEPSELVAESTAPASTPDPGTRNAGSSSLAVLEGSGSEDNSFQDENSLVIGQSDGEDRERDQKRTERFSALNSFEREKEIYNEINYLIRKADEDIDPFDNRDLQPRLYQSMPDLRNVSDDDDTDCSIDIINEQNEVNLNNVIFLNYELFAGLQYLHVHRMTNTFLTCPVSSIDICILVPFSSLLGIYSDLKLKECNASNKSLINIRPLYQNKIVENFIN